MIERTIYLEDIPLDEAKAVFHSVLEEVGLWKPRPAGIIPIQQANNRVTASAVWAKISAPHYHASAMDGYAVRTQDTVGATETNPVWLNLVEAGTAKPTVERPAQAVNTGHPLPVWANGVVMIEHTQNVLGGIEIRAALPPWHHVRPMGEDMVATELVLPANHRLRPVDLGALAGSGHSTVSVYTQPRVAIMPTGSELVSVDKVGDKPPKAGDIIEYNSLVLAGQVDNWGGLSTRWPIVPDEFEAIRGAVAEAAKNHDLVLINAGSSAGSEDYTAQVVQSLGRLLVHGVAVRPGHPVILGIIKSEGRPVPIIGVPGYPVSAALTGEIFVEPLLARWQGQQAYAPPTLEATMTRKVMSHTGDDDFVRVAVGHVGEKAMATPISRGAGVITSLVRADGLVRIPRFSEGVDAGESVTVHLYRSLAEIARTIVAIGSHDLTLDVMAQFLAEQGQGSRLSSANVGSLGGLIALRRGEAHVAGSHLLDPETGEYNKSYVKRYLPGREPIIITLVGREQGWIVPKGNPKGLQTWADVLNDGVHYVNRQRGAGTRVLFDYMMMQSGLDPAGVKGYDREEYTHLAVSAAVASGTADVGLGIRAAARALNLDFIPLTHERYDLIIPQAHFESPALQPLLDLLHNDKFRSAVAALPGYDTTLMGQYIS